MEALLFWGGIGLIWPAYRIGKMVGREEERVAKEIAIDEMGDKCREILQSYKHSADEYKAKALIQIEKLKRRIE